MNGSQVRDIENLLTLYGGFWHWRINSFVDAEVYEKIEAFINFCKQQKTNKSSGEKIIFLLVL